MTKPSPQMQCFMLMFVMVLLFLAVNTTAVAAAPSERPAAQQAQGFYYTVQWGDTLSHIAARYGTTAPAIMLANPWLVNPHLIYAGTVLFIPAGVPGVIQTPGGGTPPPAQPGCRYHHTVVWGQNLIQLGSWYGVSPFAIAEANQIFNLNRIFAGQVLCIP